MKKPLILFFATLFGTATAVAAPPPGDTPHRDPWAGKIRDGLIVLEWQDLAPAEFDPDTLFDKVASKYGITELDDNDPRAAALQAEILEIWNHAPIVTSLEGRRVRLPGLVVPLEGDGKQVSEFLLVPYFGACIHSPPPPSNQIVYIKTGKEKAQVHEMFEAVWVSGTLHGEHQSNGVGDAGYTIEADKVEPYE